MAVDVEGLHGFQLNFEGRTTSQIKRGVRKEREREILAGVLECVEPDGVKQWTV